jgi:4-amino-4-deoxy-L-arabinose transferase-like glycosyltransferase
MALHRSSRWTRVLAIFALCFVLRLLVGAVIDAAVPVIKRADVYSDIAANLTRGYGFVAEPGGELLIWRAPLYPAFLAVIYRFTGEHNGTAIFMAQTALDSITAVLIFWMGRQLFSESIGLFSAVAFALHPLSAYYSLRFMPESLFTLVLTATIAAWIVAVQSRRPIVFAAVGALVAVTALVKPVALGLCPFLAASALYWLRNEPRRALTTVMMLTIACLLVLGPWAIRNYRVTGQLVAVATSGGYAFWLGNQMASEGHEDWEVDDAMRAHLNELRNAVMAKPGVSDRHTGFASNSGAIRSATLPINITVEEDQAFIRAAWREIASHPFDSALLTVRKFFRFWFRIFLTDNHWAQSYIVVFQTLFLSFAVLGIMEARRQGGIVFPLLLPVAFFTLAHALTFATIRYSIPTVPIITLLAVVGASHMLRVVAPNTALALQGMIGFKVKSRIKTNHLGGNNLP